MGRRGGEMARIVFMGTPEFAVPCLEALIRAGHEVVGVFTQPDRPAGRGRALTPSPVKATALAHGIPVFQPESLRRGSAADDLAALRPEVIVVAAYGLLLPQKVLDTPPRGCINVHPSLLPRHRGASPIAGTILAGDTETGVTIMLMDAGMDTGPILAQDRVPVELDDTTDTLTARLALVGAELLVRTLDRWLAGEITPQPQDPAQATLTHIITKEDGRIAWNRSAVEIARQVRAFQPWPGAFTHWQGRVLKVLEAVPLPGRDTGGEPGRVVALVGKEEPPVGVQTPDGVLGLVRVQVEGRKAVPTAEFLRGARDLIGARLE
ncbi:MAG: methionyl-tRNA formyltransferase [Chloroflexi bacterium]|nr:methionyl-tRNA formyltransferase [Chloroflexota bacterium]